MKPETIQEFKQNKSPWKFVLNAKKDIEETLSLISGIWCENIKFDDKTYWDITKQSPFLVDPEPNALPSNCNWRKDILYSRIDDEKMAQQHKDLIENE